MPTDIKVVMYTPFTGRRTEDNKKLLQARQMIGGLLRDGDKPLLRTQWLVSKLNAANTHLETNNDPAPNRLFLAPEWYFRPAKGAYTRNDMSQIVNALLTASIDAKKFLIIPGSIYWGEKVGKTTMIYNTTPVVWNGTLLAVITKQNEADIDAERKADGSETWGIGHQNGKTQDQITSELRQLFGGSTLPTTGLFKWSPNIEVAVEICRDHNSGRLVDSVGNTQTDLHIVISNSTRPTPSKTISKIGGYAMQCEGNLRSDPTNLNLASCLWTMVAGGPNGRTYGTRNPEPKTTLFVPNNSNALHDRVIIFDNAITV
jgi:hypothetical protein